MRAWPTPCISWISSNRYSNVSPDILLLWLILGQSKADHRDNEAIVDDLAGQAYVDQLGTETLVRAENAMKLNKATRYSIHCFGMFYRSKVDSIKADSRYFSCVCYFLRTLPDLGTSWSRYCIENKIRKVPCCTYCESDQGWRRSEFVQSSSNGAIRNSTASSSVGKFTAPAYRWHETGRTK